MPNHESVPPANTARRACLLAAGLLVISAPLAAAPAVALPAPPVGAQAVDWDHFGEPSLSTARRANVAASRALLPAAGVGQTVDTRLYRLPGDAAWERVLGHYQRSTSPAWQTLPGADRVDTGNPARQQRFAAVDDAGQRFAIVFLPPAGEVRDGVLMVLRTVAAR